MPTKSPESQAPLEACISKTKNCNYWHHFFDAESNLNWVLQTEELSAFLLSKGIRFP